ncbi:hypothetical protein L6452_02872 [Arctium lappa]|uniref:Uncharacterized protein n=1 Tax=Arctium lappa TaxID=4217 RepID=A0ACB9FKN8_ARCLA|nr:hypothetical protein L6452_02872 [Arctium lappa]
MDTFEGLNGEDENTHTNTYIVISLLFADLGIHPILILILILIFNFDFDLVRSKINRFRIGSNLVGKK